LKVTSLTYRGHTLLSQYLAIWVEGAFHTAAPDIEAVLKMNQKNRPEHNDRRRSGFAIETGDTLLRGNRVRSVGGVGTWI
jgi:hypothetical protein